MLRNAFVFTAALFALSAVPIESSAQNPLAGIWRGSLAVNGMSCQDDRTISPTGTYSEVLRCGPYATSQTGTYRSFPNNTVSFVVQSFAPTRRYVQDTGYTGHWENNATPPGGTFRYTLPNANTLVFRDANLGGTITYHRLR